MNVSVIGPGAMGCLFAARLQRSGVKTTLVDYNQERADRLAKSGITVETATETFVEKLKATCTIPPKQNLILVLCKAYQTQNLRLPPGIPILSLQNGLGNIEALCDIAGSANVLAGSTTEASTLLEPGHIRHVASGETVIGSWTSCSVGKAEDVLRDAGFSVSLTDSPGQMIWEKVVTSAGINPLTALLGVPNGRLLELGDARKLLRDLVVEASKIAATEGYRFEYSLVERTEQICEQSGENISSMLQDIRAGRLTEIEAISGEILRRAALASLPAPRTRVIYQLIKSLEQK